MDKRKYTAVRENVSGDFYVQHGCCTMCGIPIVQAPGLFGGIDALGNVTHAQCFVKQQPETNGELNQMINVMATQDTSCVRYCGRDKTLVEKIKEVGEVGQIDWNA